MARRLTRAAELRDLGVGMQATATSASGPSAISQTRGENIVYLLSYKRKRARVSFRVQRSPISASAFCDEEASAT